VTETKEGAAPALVSLQQTVDWDALYREHGPALLRYLRRLTKGPEVAEELMQEVFARAIRATRTPGSSLDIRRWLYRIATNAAIDHLRRERRWQFLPFSGREAAPLPSDDVELVRRSLRAITPEQATALVLRLHEGFTPGEIASMLGIGESAVKSRLVRGRRAFIGAYARMGGQI
jgi:RNA polymerase sigma-70 factor (ECF subfamily)